MLHVVVLLRRPLAERCHLGLTPDDRAHSRQSAHTYPPEKFAEAMHLFACDLQSLVTLIDSLIRR